MDGVLIDAKEWHYQSLNRALKLFGLEISRYDHLLTFDGLPTRKKLEMLTVEGGLSEKLHHFINKLKTNKIQLNRKILADLAVNHPKVFFKIVDKVK